MNEILRRRRALMASKGELPILNPSVGYTENYALNRSLSAPYLQAKIGAAVTDFIYAGTSGTFVYYNPYTPSISEGSSNLCGNILQYAGNSELQTYTEYWNCRMNSTEGSFSLSATKCYVRLAIPLENLGEIYAYNSTTGEIYYAGKDTPYYGKTNIND